MEAERGERGTEGWRLAAWAALVGFLIVLGYGSRVQGGDPPTDALYRYETAVGGIVVYGMLLAVLLWIAHGTDRREFFALRRPESWPGALGLALAAYVAIFVGAGLILIAFDAGDEQGLTPDAWDSSRAGAYAANFVSVALVGPIVEELTYRGAGMTLLPASALPWPWSSPQSPSASATGWCWPWPPLSSSAWSPPGCGCARTASTRAWSSTARSTRPA